MTKKKPTINKKSIVAKKKKSATKKYIPQASAKASSNRVSELTEPHANASRDAHGGDGQIHHDSARPLGASGSPATVQNSTVSTQQEATLAHGVTELRISQLKESDFLYKDRWGYSPAVPEHLFKIGDVVEITRDYPMNSPLKKGEIVTILDIPDQRSFLVTGDWYVEKDDIKLPSVPCALAADTSECRASKDSTDGSMQHQEATPREENPFSAYTRGYEAAKKTYDIHWAYWVLVGAMGFLLGRVV